ncbi:ABC transporter permease [Catenuloplanes indicus]|uniref:ABC transport system permease protein n=1 Tax=Catenuloplanes indicus TaxID=137267 RepID=A0AAE4AWG1_9ACTN|nr:ABC transporter permease [Catenuloplanes indicus]MDQ0364999.1 putative ABC transport system permease protein [Catenuloplanes indicus]
MTGPGERRAAAVDRSRLRAADLARLGTSGLRTRPARAVLSALGIAIGIAAMIAVVGISASSRARLDAELDRLGTNLLTATAGSTFTGEPAVLPPDALGRVGRIGGVESSSSTAALDVPVYRSPLTDPAETGGLSVLAADLRLPGVVTATLRSGAWLNAATAEHPAVVLGATAADRLGVLTPGTQVWLGGMYFTVVGVLDPVPLAPELDRAALIGAPAATRLFGFDGSPTTIYERSADAAVERVRSLLGPAISPESPDEVEVGRPSDALAARNAADRAFTGLLVALGSVALLVGGIGVANTMIISVLERRREIGLRRSLGATRRHVRRQFLAEALLLSALGGVAGCALGATVTAAMAILNRWPFALPGLPVLAALAATLVIGALAGFYPAVRAARIPPTAALNTQ